MLHSTGADCHPASVLAEHRSAEGTEQSRFNEPEKHGKQERLAELQHRSIAEDPDDSTHL